jgi:NAD(P)-dependent dehydrogenase (short-subunit alcohol dehydrogenase family)
VQASKIHNNENDGTGLRDKRVTILGGTSGLGFATAEAAAHEGAAVVIASSNRAKVDSAIARLPDGSEGYVVDLSSEEGVRVFFDRIGEFDHLVFTAGEALQLGKLEETNLEQAKQFFNIRFWGAFTAAKYGSRKMRPGGSITLTNGIVGLRPVKGWTVAASITGAIEALTRALAIELAPLRVNLVCAGYVKTELWDGMPETERNQMFDQVAQKLPAGRVGEAADLAQAYLYLMRERFSTGAVIVVDGGGVLA